MAQGTNKKMELEIRREIMESVRPVFECKTCKAFPTIESVNVYGKKCTYHGSSTCGCYRAVKVMLQPKCRNGHDTGKSITITNLKKDELEWQIKLLTTIPHPCKNGKYGCQEIAMLEELPLHEDICDYRKVNCVADNCKADVCYLKYMEHFNRDHFNVSLISPKKDAGIYSFDYLLTFSQIEALNKTQHFVAFDQTFFNVICFQNGFVYHWVVLVGFKEEAAKYYYTGVHISWHKHIHACRDVYLNTLISLMNEEGGLLLRITLM